METTMFWKAAHTAQPFQWLAAVIRQFVGRLVKKREERRAIHIMSAMSDHLLRDLGIGRSEIIHTVKRGRPDTEF